MKVKAKKHLGQHFLNDENIARDIAEGLTWEGYDRVLEIGPGMGVLTKYILQAKKNIEVVEIDTESVEYLKEYYQPFYPGFKIHSEDFLKMDFSSKFDEQIAILGNFPYNISSQIIFKALEERYTVPEVCGMFQKEVAERIASKKGTKDYGILSVLAQAYYHCEYLFTVPEHVFTPPPKVKSGVIIMKRYRTEIEGVEQKRFFQVVKAGFGQRRKTLRNSLKALGIPEDLNDHEFLNMRAEQLSVEDFIELTKRMK
ncbi:16S rRNA (adenine(1518)-N(6)/adenine(1519)-N(6))-dimethyltransferase RsmA [Empedobacter falsenii]|uniref:16S rRNA (adenine(1518)-N(6)/adenine(1519)-N(6))- dimethyltransferase RsmA n=1 Tax=Empedobacter TaxID=59734 RepID=UPI0005716A49|nr:MULTISPECIES: 16S rRNA (adenine(1518)-N(6)/adenine(1519)-N(6))-dimethyltransferase RsmA [Empedobacter]HCC94410.1 16S rRNA (adenine(1518)-N(6)/adenine(1519)-N(6))-dimethyltransferase RsmA [Flavobacteriaceae bacterium]MBW1618235.1 16S rRNA (adenine(1518)-N(6)/adenine(1519)-N(6))-dimethyltransferase RsmA [Empedobacter falsenii]MBY0067061.1 16S rRNA (adenine(1518)-N(6)/adenine(1519)-N(6))-dimethyltransferase RsmA [Empedobacter falsenii]MDH0659318.1 16S rRNA (adenine(1518)-N(6)/adenine(1519)-N(6)